MQVIRNSQNIEITIDYTKSVNYNNILGDFRLCSYIAIKNLNPYSLKDISVHIDGYYIQSTDYFIPVLNPESSVTLDSSKIRLSTLKLSELKEIVYSEFTIKIKDVADLIYTFTLPLTLQPEACIDISPEIESHDPSDIHGYDNSIPDSSRREGWERKLLDLSLRNPMLNLRPNKSIVPIREKNVENIVRLLNSNTLIDFVGKPDITESDRVKDIKNLYRSATTRLEENGANSLFVALGSLRWFDGSDKRPHIAPLLFIPASILRPKALTYEIRLRDDEPMINVTLIEMLRQKFGASIPELETIPFDNEGFPDWKKVFEIIQEHIDGINHQQPPALLWKLLPDSYVGVFTFTKYLLWHDIHNNPMVLEQHPILRGFIENNYDAPYQRFEAGEIEANPPDNLILPIDYDSSQLEAVTESHFGNSFVLHGPPGTGKSQTITNMIADAIFNGKRVLFVAEKKAALEVVRTRLNNIGLMSYCLELHSNKTDKRSFFTQVNESNLNTLGSRYVPDTQATKTNVAESLQRHRDTFADLTDALHAPRMEGLSLYDFIGNYIEKGPGHLPFKYNEINQLQPSDINTVCNELTSLDLVERILKEHPADSPLKGLYPRVNTADNQQQLSAVLDVLPKTVDKTRRKASGWINRFFLHKTPEEILFANPVWKQLNELTFLEDEITKDIDNIEKHILKWSESEDKLRKWYHFSDKVNTINTFHLPKALDFYFAHHTGSETARNTEAGYYFTLCNHFLSNENTLRYFNVHLHNIQLDTYKRFIAHERTITQKKLLNKLEDNLRKHSLSSDEKTQIQLLTRRMMSNGRGVPLRKVIAESEEILQLIFPCMLMSPLSVAQYLEMRPGMFDLVIFDEASQMETPDAVGAIARGKALVVVGDPKQLPPTRFFTSQTNSGEDVEESEDADSILEDCITLGLPSKYLSRHYRSRHESLIYFSNSHFYDNKLLTFPSHNDAQRKVSFFDPRGIYDIGKTRTNLIEAKAVVDYIVSLIRNSDKTPSIGVVAFSKVQSDLIEDLLSESLVNDKSLQKKFDAAEEPLFIKNLENVQGDERDIIIFSIGYAPDVNGNVSLNFGPLNKIGGERRLNVAVSRAREEMAVFSSLKPHHIPSEGNVAKGTAALRNFLLFAASPEVNQKQKEEYEKDMIVEDIAARLRKRGHNVTTHVGRSAFKIDLAIVDPANPDSYKLGIIVDGRDYKKLPTVRDREITVPNVLYGLGWTIKRIWALDWFENPESVLDSLLL